MQNRCKQTVTSHQRIPSIRVTVHLANTEERFDHEKSFDLDSDSRAADLLLRLHFDQPPARQDGGGSGAGSRRVPGRRDHLRRGCLRHDAGGGRGGRGGARGELCAHPRGRRHGDSRFRRGDGACLLRTIRLSPWVQVALWAPSHIFQIMVAG